ncbi:MAG: hypothetical protein RIS47_343 [Bacteroidota bacterium]|jgi:glycosyltransferase involved in cell wall biosynthesis
MQKFSLVSTVYNEALRIDQTIADLQAQTLQPTEIVITDAGSTDGTWEILQQWRDESVIPIVLLREKGCSVARGRNLAIAHATTNIIASTDFGCRFQPQWLESILTPFADAATEVVGGAFSVSPPQTTNSARADYILQNGYPVRMDTYFSVSSRSIAYRKYVWQQIGGYQEWLTLAADDTIFWRQILKKAYKYEFVTAPHVEWMRHTTRKAFAREAYRYGLGDGESHINLRNTLSHIAELTARYASIALTITILGFAAVGFWILILWLPIYYFGFRSYRKAIVNWFRLPVRYSVWILCEAFLLIEQSRWAYLRGYLKGFVGRKRQQVAGQKKLRQEL